MPMQLRLKLLAGGGGDRQELWKVEPIYKSHDFTELWKRVDKRMGDFQRKYLHAEESYINFFASNKC